MLFGYNQNKLAGNYKYSYGYHQNSVTKMIHIEVTVIKITIEI